MKQTSLLVSITAALLVSALSSTSYAQNTQRSVSVNGEPVAESISYSEPANNGKPALESVITYLVTITSENGNTYNQVRYEPTFSALSGSTQLDAIFITDPGSPCKLDATAVQGVVCNVGQLQAQTPSTTFAIFFKSPQKPASGLPGTFNLGGKVYFAEGPPKDMPGALVTLGTNSPTTVKSGVRQGGGLVFTGTGGVPTDTDKNASLLSVPALPSGYSFGFSKLDENESPGSCPTLAPCLAFFGVTVTDIENGIKIRFAPAEVTDPLKQYIVVTLRRDDTLFTGSIAKATFYYSADGGTWVAVPQCAQVPDPLNSIDRCIYDRRVLKANDPEVKADPSLKGVAQVIILEKENGFFAW